MRIALYKYVAGEMTVVRETVLEPYMAGMIRVSEPIEVEFPPRLGNEAVAEEVSAIDVQIAEHTEEFAKKIDKLKESKSKLLAITQESAAA